MLGENQRLAFNKIEKSINLKVDNNERLIEKLSEEHLVGIKDAHKETNTFTELTTNNITKMEIEMQSLRFLMDLYKDSILKGIHELPKSISELLLENLITILNQKNSDKLKFQNDRFIELRMMLKKMKH
jgi:hypothetical protein